MLMLSGPVDLLVLLDLIALLVCSAVNLKSGSSGSLCTALVIWRFSLCVACLVTLVYCWLKLVAICLEECLILLLNVMVLFDCGVGAFPANVFIVLHRVCEFV